MSFPRLATSLEPFPRMVMTFENFAGHAFGNVEPNYVTFSPTTTPDNYVTFSPTTKEEKSDYDYDTSMYHVFRDHLEELKMDWPLSDKDEDNIIEKDKNKHPDKEDFDTLLIKMAYIKGNETQRSLMLSLADKLNYTL